MKLSHIKMITESLISKKLDIGVLKSHDVVDQISRDLHEKGFPASFKLSLRTHDRESIDLTFDLEDKKINDSKGFHAVSFVYELNHASSSKIHNMLHAAESDDEKYDQLTSDFWFDELTVTAEFGKEFEKVYGILK